MRSFSFFSSLLTSTLRVIIHVKLVFKYRVRYGLQYIFYPEKPVPVVEKIMFSTLNEFGTIVEHQLTIYVWLYFWTLFNTCIQYSSLEVSLEINSLGPSILFYFFKIILHFHIDFRIRLWISTHPSKQIQLEFVFVCWGGGGGGIVLNLWINLWRFNI